MQNILWDILVFLFVTVITYIDHRRFAEFFRQVGNSDFQRIFRLNKFDFSIRLR